MLRVAGSAPLLDLLEKFNFQPQEMFCKVPPELARIHPFNALIVLLGTYVRSSMDKKGKYQRKPGEFAGRCVGFLLNDNGEAVTVAHYGTAIPEKHKEPGPTFELLQEGVAFAAWRLIVNDPVEAIPASCASSVPALRRLGHHGVVTIKFFQSFRDRTVGRLHWGLDAVCRPGDCNPVCDLAIVGVPLPLCKDVGMLHVLRSPFKAGLDLEYLVPGMNCVFSHVALSFHACASIV